MKLQESQTLAWPQARKTLNTQTAKFLYIHYIPILAKDQEQKNLGAKYEILMHIVSKIQPHIRYMLGDIILPS